MKKVNRKIKTGSKTTDKLYEAVRDYIEERDGSVVIIGGIAIIDEGELKFNYGLMVRITGKKPIFTPHDTNKRIK